MEFTERKSPATCLQFHPSEFLLAAGRADGIVDFYDLEKFKTISYLDDKKPLMNNIRHIAFSETEQCLFVGTSNGVSMVGWEPGKLFDHIEGTWNNLGDMKEINNSVYCGSIENSKVIIHSINLKFLMPFCNPSNIPFHHNHSSRKSFDSRVGKLKLSVDRKPHRDDSEGNATSNDGGNSSPNLSIEMIDEENDEPFETAFSSFSIRNSTSFGNKKPPATKSFTTEPSYQLEQFLNTPTSIPAPTDNYTIDYYTSDLDYYPVRSSPSQSNVVEPEREDFPINNAQIPDYAPKLTVPKAIPPKLTTKDSSARRQTNVIPVRPQTHGLSRRLTTSVSSTELNRMDENTKLVKRKPVSRNGSPNRNTIQSSNQNKFRKNDGPYSMNSNSFRGGSGGGVGGNENNNNVNNKSKSIPVQIYTNKPVRSKTSIDIKQNLERNNGQHERNNGMPNNHVEVRPMQAPQAVSNLNFSIKIYVNNTFYFRNHLTMFLLMRSMKYN